MEVSMNARTWIAGGMATALVAALASTPEAQDRAGLQRIEPQTIAELRQWDGRLDRLRRSGDLVVRRVSADAKVLGRTHERADQYHLGVRVFGADVARQFDGGQTVSVFGTLYDDIDVDPTPQLSREDAKTAVERLTGARLGASRLPELVVLPEPEGDYTLAYRAQVATRGDVRVYFLDATTGDVVFDYSDLKTQSAVGKGVGVLGDRKKVSVTSSGGGFVASDQLRPLSLHTLDMRGDFLRLEDILNGFLPIQASDLASDADNDWRDGPTVDAHAYSGWVYDYYFKRFGRHGLDNSDLGLWSFVHPVHRQDFLQNYDVYGDGILVYYLNAFYCCGGAMVYGEGLPPGYVLVGSGQYVDFFAAALDIVAHELTHGVTEFTSNLIYQHESGALNEAFSDVMATSVEFYFEPPGSGSQRADYLIGEDVFRPGGLRSMADPAAFGDPDHYTKRYTGSGDNGGVHINSSIVNHAFYLAIEGGTNRTSGMHVSGVGAANRDQIEQVFYRAFTLLLPSNATFSVARAACEQAARDLYGAGSPAYQAISQAWEAVGVS
jgi:thermolysin